MRLRALRWAAPLFPLCPALSQTRPLVDHHQHLFSPATFALISPRPLPAVALRAEVEALLQARVRNAQNAGALRDLYTDDAWLLRSTPRIWIRGRDSVAAFVARNSRSPSRMTPVGWSGTEAAGQINAYVTEGQGDTERRVGEVLLSVHRGPDARWRIAAESHTPDPSGASPINAADLVALLDVAGIRRAVVLAMGYTWGSPTRSVENEYEKVRVENDWTSRQVAQFPDRLVAFCSFNPLRSYALDELARCARDPQLRNGLKIHIGNSIVDYHNPQHVEQMRRVFAAANANRMPIIIHMRSNVSRSMPYGRDEARIFLTQIVPAAPDVPIQIAHLAGAGGFDGATEQALGVFADAITSRDPRTARLYFEVSGVVGFTLGVPTERANQIVARLRQIGLERILFGSDAAAPPNLAPREAWAAFRQLPLTDAEFQTIANNVAPYLRP